MRPQIDLFVFQPQFAADVVSVKQNGIFGKAQQISDFLVGSAFFDQVGDFDFHGGEVKIF